MVAEPLIAWLLDSDPALRWQVERDLVGVPPDVWEATRARVATEGFGARLLALQDADGQWAGGAFFPADFDFHGPEAAEGGPALDGHDLDAELAARVGPRCGVARGHTAERLAANSRWEYDNLPYWGGEVDCCINAWTLANGVWLGADVEGIVDWFVEHRLADGGWNCEWVEGSTRSSFHSTLNSLKGLLAHEAAHRRHGRHAGGKARRAGVPAAARTYPPPVDGRACGPVGDRFVYPFRWTYNVLNAAEYFRAASLLDGAPPDPRMADAIELIRAARQPDGTWLQARPSSRARVVRGRRHRPGEPSKWLTFFGTRVLAWWEAGPDWSDCGHHRWDLATHIEDLHAACD